MSLADKLEAHLQNFSSPPYLFVGSGISRRYLGLESWAGLLSKQCQLHGLDFGYLNSSANGNLPELATGMARALHPLWWKDKKYKESREQFGDHAINDESALKFEIAKYIMNGGSVTTDKDLLEELELFRNIVVDGIVTTNWDGLLEALFPDYAVYVGQEALLFSQIQGIGEIYKIHGSYTNPNSLVLTASDYSEFDKKNPYLASKLLTFFVENPIVFLGYSLTDENILDIIHSILNCLSPENVQKLADRLVFVQWDKDAKEDRLERTILSNGGRSLPVFQATTSSMSTVLEALTRVKRKIPAKILRMLKQQVFDLVHTTKPSERIYVQDINDSTDLDALEFAVGVGIQERLREKGYTALSRNDLVRDVLFGDGNYRADLIVRDTLPELLKKTPYVPIFKYLTLTESQENWNPALLDQRVLSAKSATLETFRPKGVGKQTATAITAYDKDFSTYARQNSVESVVNHAGMLSEKSLIPDQLHKFLVDNINLLNSKKTNIVTNYYKLVCIYDYVNSRTQ